MCIMTVKQVAERLEVSQSLVYELLMSGKLQGSRHGLGRGTWRISEEQFQDYLSRSVAKPPQAPRLKWIR
jgi:excisionase family DNA binding protein